MKKFSFFFYLLFHKKLLPNYFQMYIHIYINNRTLYSVECHLETNNEILARSF